MPFHLIRDILRFGCEDKDGEGEQHIDDYASGMKCLHQTFHIEYSRADREKRSYIILIEKTSDYEYREDYRQ